MKRKFFICLCMVLISFVAEAATKSEVDTQGKDPEAKELSGMSIVGNDEAPKSLYIVPWKSSEIGVETSLNIMLDKDNVPVDREVFKRQLDFYQVSIANKSGRTN